MVVSYFYYFFNTYIFITQYALFETYERKYYSKILPFNIA